MKKFFTPRLLLTSIFISLLFQGVITNLSDAKLVKGGTPDQASTDKSPPPSTPAQERSAQEDEERRKSEELIAAQQRELEDLKAQITRTHQRSAEEIAADEERRRSAALLAAQAAELNALKIQLAQMHQKAAEEEAARQRQRAEEAILHQKRTEAQMAELQARLQRMEPPIETLPPPATPTQPSSAAQEEPLGINGIWGAVLGPRVEQLLNEDGRKFERAISKLFGRRQ